MSKQVFIGIVIVLVLAFVLVAVYLLRPAPDASTPIEAIPVEVEQPESEAVAESGSTSTDISTDSQSSGSTGTGAGVDGTESPTVGAVVFAIVQDQSEVRFSLDEILHGDPTTVVGVTNQVAGEIIIDFADPANSQVGTILVNARTLLTDNNFRNRAINNKILDTRDFEFITFQPTKIGGFPENPGLGETLTFQIMGDLTIRDITHQVTFDAQVSLESETQLTGFAETVVTRADYELNIPEVPNVADVDEEVLLEIEFLAAAK